MEDSKNADEEEDEEGSEEEKEEEEGEEEKKEGWDEEEEEWKELQESVKRDRDSQKGTASESPVVHAPYYPIVSSSVGGYFPGEYTHMPSVGETGTMVAVCSR